MRDYRNDRPSLVDIHWALIKHNLVLTRKCTLCTFNEAECDQPVVDCIIKRFLSQVQTLFEQQTKICADIFQTNILLRDFWHRD